MTGRSRRGRGPLPAGLCVAAVALAALSAVPGQATEPAAAQAQEPAAAQGTEPAVPQNGGADTVVPSIGPARMEKAVSYPVAELQGLDKVTARISTFDAPVDQPVGFGSLTIRVRACWKNPPELTPESVAYLEISDSTKEGVKTIFSGWMYASSPAVNGLEHPVYDVWVVDCLPAGDAGGSGEGGGGKKAPEAESQPKG